MSIRIMGGRLKGREVLTPRGAETVRPMTGLVKKSLFDILGPRLVGAAVADLYCGTGTLGLEALSRGAARCFFAERDRRVAFLLRRNIRELGLASQAVVWEGDLTVRLERWLEEAGAALGIAFVDPPYRDARQWDWAAAGERLFAPLARRLAPEGVVALRLPSGAEHPNPVGPLVIHREKRYGDMKVLFLGNGPVKSARQEESPGSIPGP